MDSYREFELDRDDPEATPSITELTEKVIAALEDDMRREQAALVLSRLPDAQTDSPAREPW